MVVSVAGDREFGGQYSRWNDGGDCGGPCSWWWGVLF